MASNDSIDPDLQGLADLGRRRGFVTYREVADALSHAPRSADLAGSWLEELCRARVELVDDAGGSGDRSAPEPDPPRQVASAKPREPGEGADSGDALRHYFRSVGSKPLLTREGEVEIFQRIERGLARIAAGLDRDGGSARAGSNGSRRNGSAVRTGLASAAAREARAEIEAGREEVAKAKGEVVEANLRLVIAAAKRYANQGVGLLDLIQEGNIGLMKATDRFQYRMGNKFSTYATWWVRQSVMRAIADQARTIRLPIHVGERLRKASRARRFLVGALGREPTEDEVADLLGTSVEQVGQVFEQARETVSLEMPVGEDGDASLIDLLSDKWATSPQDAALAQDLGEKTRDLLKILSPREEQILRLRFGIGGGPARTLEELGQQFHLTRERIRQIEARALDTLRRRGRVEPLRALLEC